MRKTIKLPRTTTTNEIESGVGDGRGFTLATYSISANLKAMPRQLKRTETSAHVSPKGPRRSSPPSASILRASSSNASATAVSGVSIPFRAATTAAAASPQIGSAPAPDHGVCDLNPSILFLLSFPPSLPARAGQTSQGTTTTTAPPTARQRTVRCEGARRTRARVAQVVGLGRGWQWRTRRRLCIGGGEEEAGRNGESLCPCGRRGGMEQQGVSWSADRTLPLYRHQRQDSCWDIGVRATSTSARGGVSQRNGNTQKSRGRQILHKNIKCMFLQKGSIAFHILVTRYYPVFNIWDMFTLMTFSILPSFGIVAKKNGYI